MQATRAPNRFAYVRTRARDALGAGGPELHSERAVTAQVRQKWILAISAPA